MQILSKMFKKICTSTIYNVHACTLSVPGKKHRTKVRDVLSYQVLSGDMQRKGEQNEKVTM